MNYQRFRDRQDRSAVLYDDRLSFLGCKFKISIDRRFTGANDARQRSRLPNGRMRMPWRAFRVQQQFRRRPGHQIDAADMNMCKNFGGLRPWLAGTWRQSRDHFAKIGHLVDRAEFGLSYQAVPMSGRGADARRMPPERRAAGSDGGSPPCLDETTWVINETVFA